MALSTLLDHSNIIAAISGALFAGAATYISFSEVPALRVARPNEYWRFFPYMFKNAAIMQTPLSIISGTAGNIYSQRIADPFLSRVWLGAGTNFVLMTPYTVFVMVPTIKRIIDSQKTLENESEKNELLNKWTNFHLVRTVTSLIGFSAMVYGCVKYHS